jgi:hypothetical protein
MPHYLENSLAQQHLQVFRALPSWVHILFESVFIIFG